MPASINMKLKGDECPVKKKIAKVAKNSEKILRPDGPI
jgi:hypothetical protein